jgi:GNAT superfamily N-acetyltransferase
VTIAIVPFRPDLAPAFTELNREWIERLFTLEEADWKVLRDPEASIVATGGEIFFALDGDRAVGTAAAVRTAPDTFELAKMAVRPSHQGRGLGERLGQVVVDFARRRGAARVYLETNSSLANAIRLYERLGFVQRPHPTPSDYARADVYMELDLAGGAPAGNA